MERRHLGEDLQFPPTISLQIPNKCVKKRITNSFQTRKGAEVNVVNLKASN